VFIEKKVKCQCREKPIVVEEYQQALTFFNGCGCVEVKLAMRRQSG